MTDTNININIKANTNTNAKANRTQLGFVGAAMAVARFQMKPMLRGKKLRLGLFATCTLLLTMTVTRYAIDTPFPKEAVRTGLDWGFASLLVYLLPFLFTSGLLSEEIENRTFTYLTTRPIPRTSLLLGKYLAGTSVSVLLLVGGMLLTHALCLVTTPEALVDALPSTLQAAGALSLLMMAYSALSMTFGALFPKSAGFFTILYFIVVEIGLGSMPFVFRFLSLRHHAWVLTAFEPGGVAADTVPQVPAVVSVSVLVIATLFLLGIAALVLNHKEYRGGQS